MNIKTSSAPVWLQSVFYLYLALLPLAAFLSIYLDQGFWNWFLGFPLIEGQAARFFYHVLTFGAFFLSGIFGLIIVQNTPMPKNIFAGLFMLFDAPLHLLVVYLTGSSIEPAQFILFDFVIEITGITVGSFFVLAAYRPRGDMKIFFALAGAFGAVIILSIPGYSVLHWTMKSSLMDIILIMNSLATSVFMYARAFRLKTEAGSEIGDSGRAQIFMSKVSTLAMIGLWLIMVFAYGGMLFM